MVRPSVDKYVLTLVPYARKLVLSQFVLASNYNISKTRYKKNEYTVTYSEHVDFVLEKNNVLSEELGVVETFNTRQTSLGWCSCKYPHNYGLICRHQMKLFLHLANDNSIRDSDILDEFTIDTLWKSSAQDQHEELLQHLRNHDTLSTIMYKKPQASKENRKKASRGCKCCCLYVM